jgi:hypothetical protein
LKQAGRSKLDHGQATDDSAEIRHAADHPGKPEVVALAIEDDTHRCDHATTLASTQQLANALPRLGVQSGSSLFAWPEIYELVAAVHSVRFLLDCGNAETWKPGSALGDAQLSASRHRFCGVQFANGRCTPWFLRRNELWLSLP